MNTTKIRKVLGVSYTASFGITLLAALAVSTWSLWHLSTAFFGLPLFLGWVISGIFDVGALGAAILATINAFDGESSGMSKLSVFLMIGMSAFLNAEHALMLGHGAIAALLYAAPSIAAALLLERFLDWLKGDSLRARGRVLKEFPLIRHSTILYNPKKYIGFYRKGLEIDLKVAARQLETRLDEEKPTVIKGEAERLDKPKRKPVEKKKPKAIESKKIIQDPDSGAIVDVAAFEGLPAETSHAKLVTAAMNAGLRDKDKIRRAIEAYTGRAPAPSTLNSYISRWKKTNTTPPSVGMYL